MIDFSVVVPTRNRAGHLAGLLEALGGQTFPRERFEVVLVDDCGQDDVERAVAPYRSVMRIELVHLTKQAGCAGARQAGVERARGAYLAFTDDDCAPCSEWLESLDAARRRWPGLALGGPVVNGRPESLLAEASQHVVNRFTASRGGAGGRARYFPTNNLTFPREGFEAIGGLDATWRNSGGEDRDLCRRWCESGREMALTTGAVVAHRQAMDPRRFWRQHAAYGRGSWLYLRRNGRDRESMGLRLQADLFLEPFRQWGALRAAGVVALTALSQTATTAGFVGEMFRSGMPSATATPWTVGAKAPGNVEARP